MLELILERSPMAKPLTRTQALENRAFLSALGRTGNLRLACREVGLKYGTIQHRRRVHPAFALRCEAALGSAQARLNRRLTLRRPLTLPRADARGSLPLPRRGEGPAFRTAGGELTICRLASGKLQMRRAQPGKLTREAEQAFLAALGATCNMSLAAAAAGSCFNAFNRRRRKDAAFAREVRLALSQGYDALEWALIESGSPASHEHDDWRHNDPPAIPPMSVGEALQLMYLHQKEARLLGEPDWLKRRRGESRAAHSERLTAMAEERDRRAREAFEIAEAGRRERGLPAWGPAGEAVREAARLGLPDLAQVTGWSRASSGSR
jgi:hypothetical protein